MKFLMWKLSDLLALQNLQSLEKNIKGKILYILDIATDPETIGKYICIWWFLYI